MSRKQVAWERARLDFDSYRRKVKELMSSKKTPDPAVLSAKNACFFRCSVSHYLRVGLTHVCMCCAQAKLLRAQELFVQLSEELEQDFEGMLNARPYTSLGLILEFFIVLCRDRADPAAPHVCIISHG
jgi:hypothetical protein